MIAFFAQRCKSQGVDAHRIKQLLQRHELELKTGGIAKLSIFGSVARGEAGEFSDVDLLTEFDMDRKLTAFDKAGLEVRISEILQTPAELCDRRLMKDEVRVHVEREAVVVF